MAGSSVLMTVAFALGASLPLLIGAVIGSFWQPPDKVAAVAMAFAAGALISALSSLCQIRRVGGGDGVDDEREDFALVVALQMADDLLAVVTQSGALGPRKSRCASRGRGGRAFIHKAVLA